MLVAVGLLALLVQVARVGVIWMLARALGLDVPDSVVLLAGPVVFAALALPVSLNGIGVREIAVQQRSMRAVNSLLAVAAALAVLAAAAASLVR